MYLWRQRFAHSIRYQRVCRIAWRRPCRRPVRHRDRRLRTSRKSVLNSRTSILNSICKQARNGDTKASVDRSQTFIAIANLENDIFSDSRDEQNGYEDTSIAGIADSPGTDDNRHGTIRSAAFSGWSARLRHAVDYRRSVHDPWVGQGMAGQVLDKLVGAV